MKEKIKKNNNNKNNEIEHSRIFYLSNKIRIRKSCRVVQLRP